MHLIEESSIWNDGIDLTVLGNQVEGILGRPETKRDLGVGDCACVLWVDSACVFDTARRIYLDRIQSVRFLVYKVEIATFGSKIHSTNGLEFGLNRVQKGSSGNLVRNYSSGSPLGHKQSLSIRAQGHARGLFDAIGKDGLINTFPYAILKGREAIREDGIFFSSGSCEFSGIRANLENLVVSGNRNEQFSTSGVNYHARMNSSLPLRFFRCLQLDLHISANTGDGMVH
mmetsp:Transcript_18794/g.46661  ORF Transcript_18794/g.46661 Transcript_18794/m.46661 type:complete len:229 (-) Transcript_18794:1810-2496(-)